MTHDVDALVSEVTQIIGQGWREADCVTARKIAALFATALQAEHEARVKAETELGNKGSEHLAWLSLLSTMSTERANELIVQRFAAVQPDLQNAEARATTAEAQLASACEALEKIASLREFGFCGNSVEAEMKITAEEALRSLPAPAAELVSHDTGAGETQAGLLIADGTQAPAAGWKFVPEVPTEEMMQAGLYQASHDAEYADVCQSWMDMWRIAPEPLYAHPPSPQNIGEGLSEKGQNVSESAEDRAEQFIQAAIDRAPEPLRRLGEWLAFKLDDDDWKTADRLITGAAVSMTAALTAQEKTDG